VKVKFAFVGGSGAESASQKGAAQLLATGAFAGNAEASGRRIVSFLEDHGVYFDAFADREKIVYEIRTSRGHAAPVIATVVSLFASAPTTYVVSLVIHFLCRIIHLILVIEFHSMMKLNHKQS
jgi:predicted Zn-dependent peptidase